MENFNNAKKLIIELKVINEKKYQDLMEKLLIAEAKRRGYKDGVKINKKNLPNYSDNSIWDLQGNSGFKYDSNFDSLAFLGSSDYVYRQGVWAEILPAYPQIIINGYDGVFLDDRVRFGCAEISATMFENLYDVNRLDYVGNKTEFKSVKIGAGEFTAEQIKEIAEYYLSK